MEQLIFDILDKDGCRVILTENRWTMHIIARHPDVAPYLEELKQVIQAPSIVTEVSTGSRVHFARLGIVQGKYAGLYLEVITRAIHSVDSPRKEVLTAHFNPKIPKGNVTWLQKI